MERDANGCYYKGIINPYNGHNRKLVDAICDAWDERESDFSPILYAYCLRDKDEISEKYNGFVPATPDDALDFAHEIMEYICDDLDLEAILKFLRIDF